ncbi:MAG: hypothetical protein QOD00_2932 [Blastocatellia bacterium]|jgi:hypothetical protein|nr:hypothetical protein [Blastocatellia bacterium]
MPGPVSDSFDPEFSTGENARAVAAAIQEVVDKATEVLGPDLKYILAVAQGEDGPTLDVKLTEREWRIIRFGLMRAKETI